MDKEEIIYEVLGKVAWLTINRENKHNALTPQMIELLLTGFEKAEHDNDVRVVCITGSGEKAFCSGADIGNSIGTRDSEPIQNYVKLLKKMRYFSKPIVARVNGNCMGGGIGLMLSCDIIYAHKDVKFATPEVKIGVFPMIISLLMLSDLKSKKALEMIYTARKYSAIEAEEMGLITEFYNSVQELDKAVNETLLSIAGHAPYAISVGRKALAISADMEYEEAIDYLCEELGILLKSEDAAEGLKAFLEKRQPVWKNK